MGTQNYLSQNLKAYQKLRNLSLVEFSKELDVPQSTLNAILKEGNTTLETIIRISRNLNCSLDMLVYDRKMPDKLFILYHMEQSGAWYSGLSAETKAAIAHQVAKLWEVMDRE